MSKIQVNAAMRDTVPRLSEALDRVEVRLAELLGSREPLLSEISSYLVNSGGKRVRPAVTILIYRACGGEELDDIVDVATALELIHSATLLHDDIIDDSDTRRGKPSALKKYGLAHTLVTGDFVFSRAFQLCARFEEKLINWAAEACILLTEGEVMQSRFRKNPAVTLEDYLEIIHRKTASIFCQGARTAAYLAGASNDLVEAMADCGYHVGMTFQIVDDLLDVEGKQNKIGKPVGIDLREGNPSLPIVLSLGRSPEVRRVFEMESPSDTDVASALRAIRESGVAAEVRQLGEQYRSRARACLEQLPPSEEREHLLGLVDQLTIRAE